MPFNRTSASSGRQLLDVNAELSGCEPGAARTRLVKRKIRLLLELGNRAEATACAEAYAAANPDEAAPRLVRADLACRTGDWQDALGGFTQARDLLRSAGDAEGADKIETGPMYRLSEALGRKTACLRLSEGPGLLRAVLHARASRIAGSPGACPEAIPGEGIEARLLKLERAWRGEGVGALPDLVEEWGRDEPEWRWRTLVEGISFFVRFGMRLDIWKKSRKALVETTVLDPRFQAEKRATADLFSRKRPGPQV